MSRDLLNSELLDEIVERAERHYRGRLHQAFLDWYIEAEFGRVKWEFTDDTNDGGIDAIVWRPDDTPPVVIVQSKFTENVGGTQLARRAYSDFKGVVNAFYHREDEFDGFLSAVRDDLRRLYRRAFDRLAEVNNWTNEKKGFRLITTHTRRPGAEFDRLPRESFIYAEDILRLYSHYRKGATPRARPLSLSISDKLSYRDPKRGVTSYLFNAKVSDFRNYLDNNDVARLVARNIRYNLSGRIGKDIRHTYERSPLNFWYVHNGLTIICDDLVEKDQIATLVNPSVVNGAQTLYAISGSARRNAPAVVTTRVIVRGGDHRGAIEDDQWLQGIIRGVNTQNRVRAHDFRSNEPEQIELQNRFRDVKVFYERKRGEWKEVRNEPRYRDFDRASLHRLGLILTATADADGYGVLLVKRGLDHVFAEKNYRRLFPSRAKVARRFERIYLAYRLHRLLYNRGYQTDKEWRKQRHAFWNTLWILHRGITSVGGLYGRASVRSLKEDFDAFEDSGMWGRRAGRIVRFIRKSVWAAWRKARRVDIERWTPNNFFKQKFGNRKVLALAFPRVRADLRTLGRFLARGK